MQRRTSCMRSLKVQSLPEEEKNMSQQIPSNAKMSVTGKQLTLQLELEVKRRDQYAHERAMEAMVVWEAWCGHEAIRDKWSEFQDYHGVASLRELVIDKVVPVTMAAWDALPEDEQEEWGSWDWEFIPVFLARCVHISERGDVTIMPMPADKKVPDPDESAVYEKKLVY